MSNKLRSYRTIFGDYARGYKYTFEFTSMGSLLQSIFGTVGLTNGPEGKPLDIGVACVSCPIPDIGSSQIDIDIGMHTMHLNGRHETGGTISPEFILGGDYRIYKLFRQWAHKASSSYSDTQVASSNLRTNLMVKGYSAADANTLLVNLKGVWCRSCPELAFSEDANDVIRFSPELVFLYNVKGLSESALDAEKSLGAEDER